ncbi:hypothetical protein [Mycoplasma simbae]|nr:hypothetical protein [Mycoplasma simbae]
MEKTDKSRSDSPVWITKRTGCTVKFPGIVYPLNSDEFVEYINSLMVY